MSYVIHLSRSSFNFLSRNNSRRGRDRGRECQGARRDQTTSRGNRGSPGESHSREWAALCPYCLARKPSLILAYPILITANDLCARTIYIAMDVDKAWRLQQLRCMIQDSGVHRYYDYTARLYQCLTIPRSNVKCINRSEQSSSVKKSVDSPGIKVLLLLICQCKVRRDSPTCPQAAQNA